ncbi:hypothetical protein WJX84_007253 [Apatococcus fuscideae]|uniref:F-box domain-containing protein n=1 Tax=Apatococcus fuscideae TaxID=2026836 RepID=A0AAW1T3F4_9CHLO
MATLTSDWDSLPHHVQTKILRCVPLSSPKLKLNRVSRSWRVLMLGDVHDSARDWCSGHPVTIADHVVQQPYTILQIPQQLRSIRICSSHTSCMQSFDLGALPAGVAELSISGFDHVTATATSGKHAQASPWEGTCKPQGVAIELHAAAAAAAAIQPLPLAASLQTLEIGAEGLSQQVLQMCWPLLQSLRLDFGYFQDKSDDPSLAATDFPQLQELILGGWGPETRFCPGYIPQTLCEDHIFSCCRYLSTFPNLRRCVIAAPAWQFPDINLPEGCQLELGSCKPGYRGSCGLRCRFSLLHLGLGPGVQRALSHLRLRLVHRVGLAFHDPLVLDLSPLQHCLQLANLHIAVEKDLSRAWSIAGLQLLPANLTCTVDLCPVGVPPHIVQTDGSPAGECRITIARPDGPPG